MNHNLDQQIIDLFHRLNNNGKAATIILMHRVLGKDDPAKEELELLYPGVDYNRAVEAVDEWMEQKWNSHRETGIL